MAVGGDGLKNLGIDSPPAATELMDEQRRDRTKLEIGGVEIGALLGYQRLTFGPWSVLFCEGDAAAVFTANRYSVLSPHRGRSRGRHAFPHSPGGPLSEER